VSLRQLRARSGLRAGMRLAERRGSIRCKPLHQVCAGVPCFHRMEPMEPDRIFQRRYEGIFNS
jgi:hypothetical protein